LAICDQIHILNLSIHEWEQNRPELDKKRVHAHDRSTTMPEQFENPEVTKLENETISEATAKERIERVAEKAAEKASHTEQSYDHGSSDLFKVK
jgi:hypothetical protein